MSASFITVRIFLRFAGSTFLLFRVAPPNPPPAGDGDGDREPSLLVPSSSAAPDNRALRDCAQVGDVVASDPLLARRVRAEAMPPLDCATSSIAALPESSMTACTGRARPR